MKMWWKIAQRDSSIYKEFFFSDQENGKTTLQVVHNESKRYYKIEAYVVFSVLGKLNDDEWLRLIDIYSVIIYKSCHVDQNVTAK